MNKHSVGRPVAALALAGTLAAPLVPQAVNALADEAQAVTGTPGAAVSAAGLGGPEDAQGADGEQAGEGELAGESPATEDAGQEASSDAAGDGAPAEGDGAETTGPAETESLPGDGAPAETGPAAEPAGEAPVAGGEASAEEETPAEASQPAVLSARDALSFVYASQSEVCQGDMQDVVVILADASRGISSATLVLVDASGNEVDVGAANVVGAAALFQIDTLSLPCGEVGMARLEIAYTDGTAATVDLAGDGELDYGFAVYDGSVSAYSADGGAALSVYAIDADGELVETSGLSEALAVAGGTPLSANRARSSEIVVALDPGHDSSLHPGAGGNGLREEDLTLKIAQYCKAELETYSGVSVYMTRTTSDCPYPGAASEAEELRLRVEDAVAAGASIFVSIHLNSYDYSSVSGAEVWYPNESYNALISDWGESLSQQILDQLTALGLSDRGTKENASLDDGEDYYSVIRNSKANGIAGIIVEHAFITGSADYGLLSTEEGLKALGVADATGIANYLGLSKESGTSASKTVVTGLVSIENVNATAGTFEIVATNVSCSTGIEGVSVGISGPNGENRWYALSQRADGAWVATVDTSDFGNASGSYYIEGSITDGSWTGNAFCATSQQVTIDVGAYSTTASLSADGSSVTFTASGGAVPSAWQVSFQVVGSKGTFWQVGERNADGSWSLTVPVSQLGAGAATATPVAAYASSSAWLPAASASVPSSSASMGATVSYDAASGSVVVRAEGVECTTGVAGVSVGLTAPDGTCRWYALSQAADGSWSASAPLDDFGWQAGTYRAEMSVTDASWSGVYGGTASGSVEPEPDEASAEFDGGTARYALTAAGGRTTASSCWNLSFAVWPEGSDFEHATWYQATRLDDGSWTYALPLANLYAEGTYTVQAWGSFDDGARALSSTTFEVEDLHPIMGTSGATAESLAAAFTAAGGTYPSDVYAEKGAATIGEFCAIIVEEATAEGVDPAVVYAQAMLETGYLRFGGDVDPSQCNFCGLGATGGGEPGYTFEDVREGIRAQVQHLKAYASSEALVNECVDPRYNYVLHGKNPYVENLGTRWATSSAYGYNIARIVDALS